MSKDGLASPPEYTDGETVSLTPNQTGPAQEVMCPVAVPEAAGDFISASASPSEHDVDEFEPLSLLPRIITLIAVLTPIAGLVVAMVLTWNNGFDWVQLGLMTSMYMATGLGVTIGYHRFFTHRSFETSRVVQGILAILGSMSVEGPVIRWTAFHRRHHQHSDCDEDPHTPHLHGSGFLNMTRGFFRAHVGWMFEPTSKKLMSYVPDLHKDKFTRTMSMLFPLWVLLGLLIPAVLGGVLTLSWSGAMLGFLWGGLVRVFLVHHVTWSINSVCHIWGTRPFRSHDLSRNNAIFGFLGFGEGWHNNHHAFPTSARHGLRWWEFDMSYIIIWMMARVGLAWNVRVPGSDRIAAKRQSKKK